MYHREYVCFKGRLFTFLLTSLPYNDLAELLHRTCPSCCNPHDMRELGIGTERGCLETEELVRRTRFRRVDRDGRHLNSYPLDHRTLFTLISILKLLLTVSDFLHEIVRNYEQKAVIK